MNASTGDQTHDEFIDKKLAAWAAAKSQNNIDGYKQYLIDYPSGVHADEARYLADILKQAAEHQKSGDTSKQVQMAQNEIKDASGTSWGANEMFVVISTGCQQATVFEIEKLTEHIEYNGKATDHDRFAVGNKISVKRINDGTVKTTIKEEREKMKTDMARAKEKGGIGIAD